MSTEPRLLGADSTASVLYNASSIRLVRTPLYRIDIAHPVLGKEGFGLMAGDHYERVSELLEAPVLLQFLPH